MKLKILYIVLFVTFYGFSSFATDNKSILFVNRDKIMTEALVMKDIRSQIDARRSDLQKEFSNREESLHKDEDELAKQKSILSSEAFNAKVSEFKKKVDDLQKDITNKRSELENMYISSIEQVHDKIKQISEDIAKTSNTNIVLFLMDNQVLFYDSNIDISNQVLSKLNKELSRVDIKKKYTLEQTINNMNFDIKQIIKMLPHSYPFILIDRIIECNPSQYAIAIKNVTFNEPFFMGHFPSNPIMPGVLIIEAMAQTSMVCIVSSFNSHEVSKKSVYFLAIDSAKFRKVVIPGDAIIINANVIHQRKGTCRFKCNAYVDNQLVAEAYILAMISNTVSN